MKKLLLFLTFTTLMLLTGCAQVSTQKYKSIAVIIADSLGRAERYDSVEFQILAVKDGDSLTHFTASYLGGKSNFRLLVFDKFAQRPATRKQITSFYYCLEQTVKKKFVLSVVTDAKTKRVNSFGVWDGANTFIFIIKDPVDTPSQQSL